VRKTIGFGEYNKKTRNYKGGQIYIREVPILEGGLGCALWDGSIILASWIYDHPDLFVGKTVLELGSGCGLPGILVARYAKSTLLTDYIDQTIENLKYNVTINSNLDCDEEEQESEIKYKQNIAKTKVEHLDWDTISETPEKVPIGEKFDIIIGTELTYSQKSVNTLAIVVNKFLNPNGIFYEVLSVDRDACIYTKVRFVFILTSFRE